MLRIYVASFGMEGLRRGQANHLDLRLIFLLELTLGVIDNFDHKSCLLGNFLLDCCVPQVPQDPQEPLIVSLKMVQRQGGAEGRRPHHKEVAATMATQPTATTNLRPTAMADKRVHVQEQRNGVERQQEQTAGAHAGHQRALQVQGPGYQ